MKAGGAPRRRRHPKGDPPGSPQMTAEALQEEISMLRLFTRRLLALSGGVDSADEARKDLGALGLAAIRLATLLKAQQELKTTGGDLDTVLSQALAQVLEEIEQK